jgi:hypothetical protein
MSASASDSKVPETPAASAAPVPKRITNAQTVCNEKNEKGKLCNGHLKQLRTAGEAAEVHLRGDDVLFKCQTCGTLYMGPPLGHVRDPGKQHRFVEAELSALLQAAGGTLPVIKKDERGIFIMVETAADHGHAAKPAPAKPVPAKPAAAAPAAETKAAAPKTPAQQAAPAAAPPAAKGEAKPDRTLMKRYTYSGVVDTGPVPGETFAQKVERLKAVSAGAKRRADEGGGDHEAAAPSAPAAPAPAVAAPVPAPESQPAVSTAEAPAAPESPTQTAAAKPASSGSGPDRTLMRRYTYVGVVDTGPVPGETFAQKVERLRALAAAAKQRSEGG